MKKNKSLTYRLSFIISAITLAIFLAILLINYEITRRHQLEDARKDAENISKLTVSQIEEALNTVELPTKYLAKYLSQNEINESEFSKMIELLTTNDDRVISSFALYFKNERRMAKNRPSFHFYKNGLQNDSLMLKHETNIERWASKLQATNKPYWSEPYLDDASGELTAAYLVPAHITYTDSTPIRGLIGVEFRLQWLKAIIDAKKTYSFDYVFILSKEGKAVVSPGLMYDYNTDIFQVAKDLNNPELIELAKKMLTGKSGSIEVGGLFQGFRSLLYYMPVPSTNWSVAVVFPKKDLLSSLYDTTLKLGISGLIGFILILLSVILITKHMTRPLQELSFAAREIGQGNFKVEIPEVKSNDEVKVLRESLDTMQQELQAYIKNLLSTEKFRERIESELHVANDIQMGYLRKDFTAFSENRNFKLVAALRPARQIGGDFYDYFMVNENTLCFAIGDVAGKGIPAALFMTMALTLTRSGAYTKESLGKIVKRISDGLGWQNENAVFTTFFIGMLNTESGELTFCNAGHNFPYLLKDNELFEMKATHGPALGVVENVEYKTGKVTIGENDRIILYTDGVIDAENEKLEFFTKETLEEILSSDKDKTIQQITTGLVRKLQKHIGQNQQSDDITILAIEYLGKDSGTKKTLETDKSGLK